jgi:hypothetical protein
VIRRFVALGGALLIVVIGCVGCSSPSTNLSAPQNLAACNAAYRALGPTVPTTIPSAAVQDLLNILDHSNNPQLVAAGAQLRAAEGSGEQSRIIAAVGAIATLCQQDGVGTPIT